MRKEIGSFIEANGLWDPATKTIIIKRSQLRSIEDYGGTLLHETVYAISGASDVSRDFETKLTELLGKICGKLIKE